MKGKRTGNAKTSRPSEMCKETENKHDEVSISYTAIASVQSGENPSPAAGALFPDKIHLVLLLVVDFQLRQVARGLGDEFTLAQSASVSKELFLEVFADPLLNDDVVAVELCLMSS